MCEEEERGAKLFVQQSRFLTLVAVALSLVQEYGVRAFFQEIEKYFQVDDNSRCSFVWPFVSSSA